MHGTSPSWIHLGAQQDASRCSAIRWDNIETVAGAVVTDLAAWAQ